MKTSRLTAISGFVKTRIVIAGIALVVFLAGVAAEHYVPAKGSFVRVTQAARN